ncbi:enoyl-CoA hydratase/isomerase family protein [Robiginitomaculum antarcticum]|uniref:enoyl-CoA hydratase/isomerase family protein n=1 Tax=Robiginitomaculum antarcticum TaxID=437507 RepID=UPI00037EDFA1|nr:enoyl-CoA hydratase-related protein [Robiginitomaculum antarcticum]
MSDDIKLDYPTQQIGRIRLNQPSKRNALSAQMWADLRIAISEAAKNPNLCVLMIVGEGEHFAAGADITEFSTLYETPASSAGISKMIAGAMDALAKFPKPTIAKIRGACVGGGCGIALACDIRISDGTAVFAITPGQLGLVYPFADIARLIQAVGVSAAKDMLYTARKVDAKEAKHMGLINRLVDQYELDQVVRDYALSICATSGQSNIMTKKMFLAYEAGQRVDSAETQDIYLKAFSSSDFKEGYTAFMEKRKPDFS